MNEASKVFIENYIIGIQKVCSICEKAVTSSAKIHVSRKHKGLAAKEYSKTL